MERIQKIVAQRTRYSRRAAEDLIREGRITVNGKTAAIGDQADPEKDWITLDGKPLLTAPASEYILLSKPRGYLCTMADPGGRPTVLDLVSTKVKVYPVGRLDMESTGIILLTNDGDLTRLMTKAGRHCPKVYLVKVAGVPGDHLLERLRKGILVEGVRYAPCEIEARRTKPGSYTWYRVTLHQGKNRQIRKMFEAINHPVFQIKRIAIGPLTDAGLETGQWRRLTEAEVRDLKRVVAGLGRRGEAAAGEVPLEGRNEPGGPPPPDRARRPRESGGERPLRRNEAARDRQPGGRRREHGEGERSRRNESAGDRRSDPPRRERDAGERPRRREPGHQTERREKPPRPEFEESRDRRRRPMSSPPPPHRERARRSADSEDPGRSRRDRPSSPATERDRPRRFSEGGDFERPRRGSAPPTPSRGERPRRFPEGGFADRPRRDKSSPPARPEDRPRRFESDRETEKPRFGRATTASPARSRSRRPAGDQDFPKSREGRPAAGREKRREGRSPRPAGKPPRKPKKP